MEYTGEQLRAAFLAAVEAEWKRTVRSVGDEERISRYFRETGWGWALNEGGMQGVYDDVIRRQTGRGGPHNYCGIGLAWCGVARLGHHIEEGLCLPVRLRMDIAVSIMPSTARIYWMDWWENIPVDPMEQIAPGEIQPGDIVTVKTGPRWERGDHFVMSYHEPVDGILPTYEFNASGELGDGSEGRGVVRRTRKMKDVAIVYRPDVQHFEEVA